MISNKKYLRLIHRIKDRLKRISFSTECCKKMTNDDIVNLMSSIFDEIYSEIDENGRAVISNTCTFTKVGREDKKFIEFKDKRKKE